MKGKRRGAAKEEAVVAVARYSPAQEWPLVGTVEPLTARGWRYGYTGGTGQTKVEFTTTTVYCFHFDCCPTTHHCYQSVELWLWNQQPREMNEIHYCILLAVSELVKGVTVTQEYK